MKTQSFRRLSLISSLVLLAIFIAIALQDVRDACERFDARLEADGRQLHNGITLGLQEEQNQMLMLASMVAAVPDVQKLFYDGARALEAKGGATGGADAARLRRQLYERLAPMWTSLQQHYGLRQLHFHIPPATSYLRIHSPERFGDSLEGLRPIISDTNATQQSRAGFEIGRIYSGLRGLVPAWYSPASGERQHVGSLEAGTSMDGLLERMSTVLGAEFALLLDKQCIEGAVWDAYQPDEIEGCDCYLESSSDPRIREWITGHQVLTPDRMAQGATQLFSWQGREYGLRSFPFKDYRGERVGQILAWQDVTELRRALRQSQQKRLLFFTLGYGLTLAIMLLLLLRLRATMQQRIDGATLSLSRANDQLDSVLRDSPVVSYRVPLPGTAMDYISPNCEALLGYAPKALIGDANWWFDHIHEDDRDAVRATLDWTQWPERGIRRRYRLKDSRGDWHWVEDRCRHMQSASGEPVLNGVMVDVTAQHQAEQALQESERDLKRAQEAGHVGSWQYRFGNERLSWSDEVYHIFGLPQDIQPDYPLFLSLLHPEDRELVDSTWREAMETGDYAIEHRIIVDGAVRWIRQAADFEHDENGQLRAVGIVQDITEQKLREQELQRLATTDMLTGMANRRHFMQSLAREQARIARWKSKAALMMMDLDFFKQINDRYGHAAGDQVLKDFARSAAVALRSTDSLGRLGGEEFAALLPETDIKGALTLAERIRQDVKALTFTDYPGLTVTVSIGVTQIQPDDADGDRVLLRADKALYRAKNAGRDRVESE